MRVYVCRVDLIMGVDCALFVEVQMSLSLYGPDLGVDFGYFN